MISSVFLYLAIVVMWLCVLVPMWLRRDRNTVGDSHKDIEPYAYDEQTVDEDSTETLAEPLPAPSSGAVSSSPSVPASAFTSASMTVSASVTPEGGQVPPSGARGTSPGSEIVSEIVSEAASETGIDAAPERSRAGRPATRRTAAGGAVAERRRAECRRRAKQVAKRRRLTLWCVLLLLASVVTAAVQVIPWWGVAPSVVLLGAYLSVLRVTVQMDAEWRRAAAQARAERARRARRRAALLEAQRPVAEIIDLDAHRDELFDQYAEPSRRAVGD